MFLVLSCIVHISPKKQHKNWWKHNWNPFYTSITTIKNTLKKKEQTNLKLDQKYPHLLGDKFVNGDIFYLFKKHVCSFTFGGINITIFFRCDSNARNKICLALKNRFEITCISNK
jgi:hypothetical protein